jgi:Anti-sigma factor NepR
MERGIDFERHARRSINWVDKMHVPQAVTAGPTGTVHTEPTTIGATDRLDALGQALYGKHWVAPMARDLKMRHDTIANWALRKRELPSDHPIFTALATLVHYHEKAVANVRKPTNALSRLSDNNESKPAPALGPYVMKAIGRELRAMHEHIIAEGVPERFAAILRRLDEPSNERGTP